MIEEHSGNGPRTLHHHRCLTRQWDTPLCSLLEGHSHPPIGHFPTARPCVLGPLRGPLGVARCLNEPPPTRESSVGPGSPPLKMASLHRDSKRTGKVVCWKRRTPPTTCRITHIHRVLQSYLSAPHGMGTVGDRGGTGCFGRTADIRVAHNVPVFDNDRDTQSFFFVYFFLVQTKMSWRSLLSLRYSR